MNPKDKDDLIHAITQVHAFYNKELDELQVKFWLRALANYPVLEVKRALADYTAKGRYAPKPVDITDAIDASVEQGARALPPPEITAERAPPEVASAWAYVIKLWGLGDIMKGGAPDDVDAKLELCNRQAFGNQNPESIPPDAWLEEIWGCDRDEAVRRYAQ